MATLAPSTHPAHAAPLQAYKQSSPATSGQQGPLLDRLVGYDHYPQQIEGQTVWTKEALDADEWRYYFSDEEVDELERAVQAFRLSGTPLEAISPRNFPLVLLADALSEIRRQVLFGRGFILFKGLPVDRWDKATVATVYLGLGSYFGHVVSQNSRGHLLGHVQDLGEDSAQTDKVRIYRTNARQFFHTDDSDVVGLLCLHRAAKGGESDIVSSHHIYNVLRRERPDVLKTLIDVDWYVDRKGEISPGQEEYIKARVMHWQGNDPSRIYTKWDPYYVRSLERLSMAGIILALSADQLEAIQVLEATCLREALHMVLEAGDIQILANTHVLHARTAYIDPIKGPRRHLMRLWLATPDQEGGWEIPFADSGWVKRGGIVVEGVPERAILQAE